MGNYNEFSLNFQPTADPVSSRTLWNQNRSKKKTVVRVIAFLLIVALVYGALTRLLTINNATEQQYIRSFYLEPKKLARRHDPRCE